MKIIIEGNSKEIAALISRKEEVDIKQISATLSQKIRKAAFRSKPHMEYRPSNEEIALTIQKLSELKQEPCLPNQDEAYKINSIATDDSKRKKGFTPDSDHNPYEPWPKKTGNSIEALPYKTVLDRAVGDIREIFNYLAALSSTANDLSDSQQ